MHRLHLKRPGLLGTGSGMKGAWMLEVKPLSAQDAHLKGECLTGKRANCVRGLVAMVLCYFFNMLYRNSSESRGRVTEEGEGRQWDDPG